MKNIIKILLAITVLVLLIKFTIWILIGMLVAVAILLLLKIIEEINQKFYMASDFVGAKSDVLEK